MIEQFLERLPEYENLWALWLVVPSVIFIIAYFFRKPSRLVSILLRSAFLLLLIAAMANFSQSRRETRQEIVSLVDVSSSIPEEGREELVESILRFVQGENKELYLYPFAASLAQTPIKVAQTDSARDVLSKLSDAADEIDRGDTDLSAGLSEVLGRQTATSILLASDGWETKGDLPRALSTVKTRGVRLFPLIPDTEPFTEASFTIADVYAPLVVQTEEKIPTRIALRNTNSRAESGTIELWIKDKKVFSKSAQINPGAELLLQTELPPEEKGLHQLRVVLTREDGTTTEQKRWIAIKQRSKVLLLSGTDEDELVLKRLLDVKGYTVESIVATPNKVPESFESYSNIIINNVPKSSLGSSILERIKSFSASGGGVLLVGGDRSFGLGGYIDTPIEEISPLKFLPPQTQKKRLTKAIALVIDKSRSMVFQDKIISAKKAALTTIEALKDDDFVGVIGFDSTPFVIIRVSPVSQVKGDADRRLRNLTAAGKTDLFPALAAARQELRRVDASRKHIIVLSDGKVPVIGNLFQEELQRLRQAGITLSAVALGIEADIPFMQTLAQQGTGAFYHTMDPTKLPQIFLHDIKVSTGEKTLKEKGDFSVIIGPAGLHTLTITDYPPLKGFVETLPKKGSRVELATRDEKSLFPIFASWQYGKGKVFAFTSDANGRWSANWLRWKQFVTFWEQVVEKLKEGQERQLGDVNFDLRYTVQRKELHLDLIVYDPELAVKQPPVINATIVEPNGEVVETSFVTTRKGRFSATIDDARPGDYRISMTYGKAPLTPVAISLGGESFGERSGQGINVQGLSDLAYETGGSINPSPEDVTGSTTVAEQKTYWYPTLLKLALLLLFIEIFVREQGGRVLKRLFSSVLPSGGSKKRGKGIYKPVRKVSNG